jgi:hypothetical protein
MAIRFKGTMTDGRTLVGIGITEANVKRLKDGEPIVVRAESVGLEPPVDIVIIYGKTLDDLSNMLAPMLGPETKIEIDPLLKAVPEDVRTKKEGQNRSKRGV